MKESEILARYLADHADSSCLHLIGPAASSQTIWTEPVVFVDGGASLRIADEGISVGDGDSYDGCLDHRLDADKDFSDLAFVLHHLNEHFHEIVLIGFLGGRRDHELLNFGEVFHFLGRCRHSTRVRFERQVEAFSAGDWEFESHGTFSLVLFAPCGVTLQGDCRYPIEAGVRLSPLSSFGLSNEGHGKIELRADGPVFIFHDVQ